MKPEMVTLQRLGYILEFIEESDLAKCIANYLKTENLRTRPLVSGLTTKGMPRNTPWGLYINYDLEPDL